MARVVSEVRPKYVFVENSPMLTTRGGARVVGDLAEMGYDCKWTVMGAADVGANHKRDRMWIVGKLANTKKLLRNGGIDYARISLEQETQSESGNNCGKTDVGKSKRKGLERQRSQPRKQEVSKLGDTSTLAHTSDQGDVWRQWQLGFAEQEHDSGRGKTNGGREWWKAEPNVGRVVDGVAARVDRLKAIGNGQVPLCAATAWKLLTA
jgi:DNA (cytosine-5)-methyltransferase 1